MERGQEGRGGETSFISRGASTLDPWRLTSTAVSFWRMGGGGSRRMGGRRIGTEGLERAPELQDSGGEGSRANFTSIGLMEAMH